MKSPYNGEEFKNLDAAPKGYGAGVKLALFAFFVLTRAFHPLIIDASKSTDPESGKRYFAYGDMTVVLCENMMTIVAMQVAALAHGGIEEWKMIWRPEPLKIFSLIGLGYAFGDYLEMCSMGALGGAAYQILLQSKLIITAFLTWYLKGIKQSPLQANILLLIVVAMSSYTIAGSSSGSGDGGIPLIGFLFVFGKVFISCLCAVLTDKYMRNFADEPIHVQIVQFKFIWFIATLTLCATDGKTFQNGFFHGWDGIVVLVWSSFTIKNWCTNYILAILDSLLKNIGEAVAVLVIYVMNVILPQFDTKFELPMFLSVMIVILSVTSYILAKTAVEKAAKFDKANV